MATTDQGVIYDIEHVKALIPNLPKPLVGDPKVFQRLASAGVLQRDRLFELALVHCSRGGFQMDSVNGRDFTDGTDAKSVTVNYRPDTGRPSIIITNVKEKEGALRVMALDPMTNTFRYYFIFDYDSVRNYDRIEFGLDSNSKYINGECGYEVDSLKELAKIPA